MSFILHIFAIETKVKRLWNRNKDVAQSAELRLNSLMRGTTDKKFIIAPKEMNIMFLKTKGNTNMQSVFRTEEDFALV